MSNQFQEGVWFVGIVVDVINDPDKLGYIKVRIPLDDDGILDEDLPWSYPLLPITSASYKEIGISPTGIEPGSQVFGMYLDSKAHNERIVLGSIPAIREGDINQHDVSKLARGLNKLNKSVVGTEPKSAYNATYPYNKVLETRSGHAIEIDDSPGAERIHVFHKSGTYVEINNEGRMVTKINGDNYTICAKDDELFVQGNINITVKGNAKVSVDGNLTTTVEGDFTLKSSSQIIMKAPNIDITEG